MVYDWELFMVKKWSTESIKNWIWAAVNRNEPIPGGVSVEALRQELINRGMAPIGYHNAQNEYFDDLLYDRIRDIPCVTMQRMAALKRYKQDGGMTEFEAAIAAIREIIGWK